MAIFYENLKIFDRYIKDNPVLIKSWDGVFMSNAIFYYILLCRIYDRRIYRAFRRCVQ